jgi:hypothetical protein
MIADIAGAAPSRSSATTVRSAGSAVATSSTGLEDDLGAHKSVEPALAAEEKIRIVLDDLRGLDR